MENTYNGDNCPCKRVKCERHGDCEACRLHHHSDPKKYMTGCERLIDKEEKRIAKAEAKEEKKILKEEKKAAKKAKKQ